MSASVLLSRCGTGARFDGSSPCTRIVRPQEGKLMNDAHPEPTRDREAIWRMHSLCEPTFTDLTHGIFLGVVWSALLWAPMFISVLL